MDFRFSGTFWKLADAYNKRPRYIDSEGGTRSGKTFAMLQLLYLLALKDKAGEVTSVVSENLPHLKRGAIRDFKILLGDAFNEAQWNKTDGIYTTPNGAYIEFFGADNSAKVHGAARKRLFINEAQNIAYEVARQLFVRTTETIFYDYNPTHPFWAHTEIQPRDNCVHIHSTYKDNQFLTAQQVAEIEVNKKDLNWWRVYGLGLVGQLEGVIFDFETIDVMPDGVAVQVYGLDFGFTNDPTALIRVMLDTKRKIIYAEELVYNTQLVNDDIIKRMKANDIRPTNLVVADAAEPKTIEEIRRAGFNVKPSYKATRKAEQLQALRGWALKVTKPSINLIKELRGYTWDKDKDGKMLNEPISVNDHAIDAMRYAVFTWLVTYCHMGKYKVR